MFNVSRCWAPWRFDYYSKKVLTWSTFVKKMKHSRNLPLNTTKGRWVSHSVFLLDTKATASFHGKLEGKQPRTVVLLALFLPQHCYLWQGISDTSVDSYKAQSWLNECQVVTGPRQLKPCLLTLYIIIKLKVALGLRLKLASLGFEWVGQTTTSTMKRPEHKNLITQALVFKAVLEQRPGKGFPCCVWQVSVVRPSQRFLTMWSIWEQ